MQNDTNLKTQNRTKQKELTTKREKTISKQFFTKHNFFTNNKQFFLIHLIINFQNISIMKKMFLFAAAAMVSLSSCVQTNEVYTGKLEEMGFKSAVTRGIIQTTEDMTYPISVTAIWDNPSDASSNYVSYFENAKFVYDAQTTLWKGEPAKYWPTSGDMDFLALCPYPINANVVPAYKVDGTIEKLTFGPIDNNLKEQHDVLYSDLLSVEAPQTAAQNLLFHHAYAQLNTTFKKTDSAAVVVVKSVSVQGVHISGNLTVTPVVGGESTAIWATPADQFAINRYFLPEGATAVENGTLDQVLTATDSYSPTPVLVVPSNQTSIVIVYTIDGVEHKYTHTLSDEWKMGYKYTYNYTINVNEIMFNCQVDEWTPVDGGTITI